MSNHTSVPTRLRADGVTVGYGDAPVVRDLSLTVPDGKVTTIIGPNGCGKSTLLRTLARLLKPSSGTVRLDGEPIGGHGGARAEDAAQGGQRVPLAERAVVAPPPSPVEQLAAPV